MPWIHIYTGQTDANRVITTINKWYDTIRFIVPLGKFILDSDVVHINKLNKINELANMSGNNDMQQ